MSAPMHKIIHRALVLAALLCLGLGTSRAVATPPTFENIGYASHWRQRLDLYIPQDRPGPFPVVIYFHGGGWLSGDKSLASRYADELMARGLAVAAVNYRFSYHVTFPGQLFDCKGAIRWLRAHADEYDLDASRFAAFGESAGGHLASLVATVTGDDSLEGSVGGNTAFSSRVQAVVHGYGPTDLIELALFSDQRGSEISALIGHDIYDIIEHQDEPAYEPWITLVNLANPVTHTAADDPPAYIVHGDGDDVVPASQSALLAAALDDVGAAETFRLMPGVGHEIPDDELPDLYAFLSENLKPLPVVASAGGNEAAEAFGRSVAVLGDVNGDNLDEILIGAPLNDDRGQDAGRVAVIDGATGNVLRIIRGRNAGDRFGHAIASCGDVNADGLPDLIVGSPMADTASGTDSGRVEIFSGGTWKRLRTFDGERAHDQLGLAVAGADVDGDGRRDVIAGAPFADLPATNAGCTLIWSSATGTLLKRIKGTAKNDRLGWAIASAGDVDGDGRADVLIGAPWDDAGGPDAGLVKVIGFDGVNWLTRLVRSGAAGDQLGYSVAGLGDVDGDDLSDVAAGAPRAVAAGVAAGNVRLFAPASGSDLAILQPVGRQLGERFGAAIAAVGDLDGDGIMDVIVGSPNRDLAGPDCGRITAFAGGGVILALHDGPAPSSLFGEALAGRALIVAGSPPEVVVGAPGMTVGVSAAGVVYIVDLDGSP